MYFKVINKSFQLINMSKIMDYGPGHENLNINGCTSTGKLEK